MIKAPNSMRNLDKALHRLAGDDKAYVELRILLANIVVCQLNDDIIVKGGTSLKFRFGDKTTRFTNDLDAVLKNNIDELEANFRESLEKGWNGFSGYLKKLDKAHPKNIHSDYVMQPYEVKLQYMGKSWDTVQLELTPNEIDDAEYIEEKLPMDAVELVRELGFEGVKPIRVMNLEYQIAQKLHGLTEVNSDRGHDLIDIQIICKNSELDYATIKQICKRLFAYRKLQKWPTLLEGSLDLESKYNSEASSLDVIQDFDEAINWVNNFIHKIEAS